MYKTKDYENGIAVSSWGKLHIKLVKAIKLHSNYVVSDVLLVS